MRYKDLTVNHLEQLQNSFKVLELLLNQGAPREQVMQWFEQAAERIDQVKTMINRESQD